MNVQRLSTVSVGSHIKLGGQIYKFTLKYEELTSSYTMVAKRIARGIYESPTHIRNVVSYFTTEEQLLVEVLEEDTSCDLGSGLQDSFRAQLRTQSLTESFRSQVEEGDDEDDYEDDEEGIEEHLISVEPTAFHVYGTEVQASQSQALTTSSLRAQAAQQSAQQAQAKAGLAQASASAVRRDFDSHQEIVAEEIDALSDRVSDAIRVGDGEIGHIAYLVSGVEEEQEEHENRISYLERKHYEEEQKLSIQREFNAKLAQQKQQAELQEKFNQSTKTTGGNGKMKNLLGGFKSQFGKVEGKFAFAATGGLAIRKGISQEFVAFDKETNSITDVSGLTLDFKIPAFKLPTAVDQVKKGDIVLNGADFGYVTRVHDDFLEVIIPEKNVNGSVRPTRNALLNASFYTVVQTIDAAGQGGFNPMLLMAMGDGNKDEMVKMMALSGGFGGGQQGGNGQIDPMMFALLGDNMDELLPLLLLQQGGAVEGNGIQSMLPFLLMSDKEGKGGKSNDMLPLLMMSQGQQGGQAGGINPMMMMALSGDSDIDPMTMMMMSGGFGNGQQGGGLFGGQAPQSETQQNPSADNSTDGE